MSANKYLQQLTGSFQYIQGTDISTSLSTAIPLAPLNYYSSIISSNTTSSSTTAFIVGTSVTQGSSGTWMVQGWATWSSSLLSQVGFIQLSDGSTRSQVFASASLELLTASAPANVSVQGIVTSPTSNISMMFGSLTPAGNITLYRSALASLPSSRDTGIIAVRIG